MSDENSVYVDWEFDCPVDTLFEWLSKPELFVQWFGPEGLHVSQLDSNFEVGGSYVIMMNNGDREVFKIHGNYLDIIHGELISITYAYDGLENPPPPSVVTFRIKAVDEDKSSLRMQQKFEIPSPDMAIRTVAWNYMFDRLEKLL